MHRSFRFSALALTAALAAPVLTFATAAPATAASADADIDAAITNICRCGTFQQVREAIHAAAKS